MANSFQRVLSEASRAFHREMDPTYYEGCYCCEDGCHEPATTEREVAPGVWELVCGEHA